MNQNIHVLVELCKRDFKSKYLGSYFGVFWAFINPVIYIGLLWLIFGVGFKSKPVDNVPYLPWLMAGMIPWLFFSDALIGGTLSVVDNAFLVKKVVFNVNLLPISRVISNFIIHIFILLIVVVIFILNGWFSGVHSFQLIYFVAANFLLVFGISLITSSIAVFFRDITHIIGLGLQFLFWATPIFWPIDMIPSKYRFLIFLNPVYYIINGYRDSLICKKLFWDDFIQMTFFWIFLGIIFFVGFCGFRKARKHFSDFL